MIKLNHDIVGLTPTGAIDKLTPRKEYRFSEKGRYTLASFFIISPQIFLGAIPRTVWLTPATMEDLLIFFCFCEMHHKYVHIDEDKDTHVRTLFAFDNSQEAKQLFNEGKIVVVNPSLLSIH